MGLEDARLLLMGDEARETLGWALKRWQKHLVNEETRRENGLPSDMERWMKTGECWD